MNKLIAILLIVGVLLQSMSKLVIIVNYDLRKDYIAKNLCENRDKPQMKCCGKCYLKKQLNKTEDSNSKQAPNKDSKSDVVALIKEKIILPEYQHFEYTVHNTFWNNHYAFNYQSAQFHPPSFLIA
jgi:hypothetical protein